MLETYLMRREEISDAPSGRPTPSWRIEQRQVDGAKRRVIDMIMIGSLVVLHSTLYHRRDCS
jgi:hypothetical protein